MTTSMSGAWRDDSGATLVEYGLMIALVALICIGAVALVGQFTQATHEGNATAISDANEQVCRESGGVPRLDAGGRFSGCTR